MANENKKEEEKDPMDNVRFKNGKEFPGGWVIEKTLDEGGFGQVYLVRQKATKKVAALKAESNDQEGGSAIKLEQMILKKLNANGPVPHIPVLFAVHRRVRYSFMIMTLLGENLKSLKLKQPKERFTRGTWSRLGIQCLYSLKYMHDCGFVHRDIKPQNFMMGSADDKERARIVHILDFGLARPFATYKADQKRWVARRARGTAEFRGTLRYTSPNVHLRKEQGRADDIWSLIYVLIELNGGLPWQTVQKREEVEAMKLTMNDQDVMLNMPQCMSAVMPHLRKLHYYQRPDYVMIFKSMWQVMVNEKQTPISRFDWETKDPDPSVPPADWENKDGKYFVADPIEINGPPNASAVAESTHQITENGDALKSEKVSSAKNGKKK
uniref:non-specific serine/threonine protein kinase n=1 Tax=Caenorhabditis japonica TaxID=281687 RepID=A0A8R1E2G8_CAEJA